MTNPLINTNSDGEIECDEASAYNGYINVSNQNISDLTGIEAFTALQQLTCSSNQLTTLDLSSNTALTDLNCGSNQITSINVTGLTNLTSLDARANQFSSIDVSTNTALTYLDVENNPNISSLDVTNNTAMQVLVTQATNISSLNVSAMPNLSALGAGFGPLSSIDVTHNTQLLQLNLNSAQLTSLDLSNNPLIQGLGLQNNQLTSIDVSNMPSLVQLQADGNQLTSLNIQNGNNTNLNYMNASNNPSLTCIQVDDVTYANSNSNWTKDAGATYNTNCSAPPTPAASLNFDGADDKVIVTNGVDLSNQSFSVEMWLKQSGNSNYAIAFSQGPNYGPNQTLHIGFGPGGNFFMFNFYQNDLGTPVTIDFNWHHWACTFDNVTKDRKIYRDGVLIASDISTSAFLGDGSNSMYIGDVAYGNNNFDGAIDELRVWTRSLSQSEIQNNMNCEVAPQSGLAASYHFNQGFDGANNSSENILTDASGNGNNGSLNNFALNGSTSNWVAPGGVVSGTVCPPCVVNIPDANFKAALLANAAINTNSDGEIQCSEAAAYTGTINVIGLGISDLTGIEAFTSLTQLEVNDNSLTALDLTSNIALTWFTCTNNQLTSLNLTGLSSLGVFNCNNNQLTNLDVSTNTALTYMECSDNQLTTLDVSNNALLDYMICANNQLTILDVSNNPALVTLNCVNNLLTSLDVTANPVLAALNVIGNQLSSLNTSSNPMLSWFMCRNNQLTSLDLSNNPLLGELNCNYNLLTSLDLTANTALTYLEAQFNQLTSLNTSSNPLVTTLSAAGNQITSLDLTNNTALTGFNFGFNQLTSLDLSHNSALIYFDCQSNLLTSLNFQNGNFANNIGFYAYNNPTLTCIQVDDVAYANANWSGGKDAGATFSLNCGCVEADVPTLSSNFYTVCAGSTISVSIVGGNLNSATDWSWSQGSCNGPVVATGTSVNLTPTSSTIYYVHGTGGCTSSSSNCEALVVTVSPTISLFAVASNVTCNGGSNGSIDLTVSGGTPSYSYNWSNTASNEDIISLSPGFYQVTVTDASGCNAVDSAVIVQPIAITLIASDTIFCIDNGSHTFKLIASGGLVPYTFSGDDTVNTSAGIHTFTLTDANGCYTTVNANVDTVSGCILAGTGSWLGKIDSIIGPALFYLSVIDTLPVDTFQQIIASVNADSIVYKFNFDTTKVLIDVIIKKLPGNLDYVKSFLQTPAYGMTYFYNNSDTTLTITGYYPIGHLLLLNSRTDVINFARPNNRPFSSSGLIYSQGDHAMKGDSARTLFGLDGSGIKVGVLSDSYNTQPGNPAAIDLGNNDLPGLTNSINGIAPQIKVEYPFGRAVDEGRAMMQIVHDIAPKSELEFRTGFISPVILRMV